MIELVVALALTVLVFGAAAAMLVSGMRDQTTIVDRSAQLQQAEIAMQRLVVNLRQATSFTLNSGSSITYSMPTGTTTESVAFSCSATTEICTQTIGSVKTTEITGVANSTIFTDSPTTNPTYVGISLTLAAAGEIDVTITDGTGLRNITLGQ